MGLEIVLNGEDQALQKLATHQLKQLPLITEHVGVGL